MRWHAVLILSAVLVAGNGSRAADVRFVQVAKTVSYVQLSAGPPLIQTNAYEFRVRVDLTRQDSLAGATVQWPLVSTSTRFLSNNLSYWEFSQRFPTSVALNSTAPNGTYLLFLQGAIDGRKTNALTLSGDVYPNPVHISNYAAAQSINARNDFTLQWDPPGTSASDFVQVRVFEGDTLIYETGAIPGGAGTLSGATVSAMIPRATLRDGAVYRAQIVASRKSTSDTKGYAGVPAWAIYARLTEFTLRTIYPTLDVNWFGIAKIRRFSQTSALAPMQLAQGAFTFSTFSLATDPLNLKSASIKLPNGQTRPFAAAGAYWSWSDSFDTQQLLDASYGGGTYELNLQTTHNGTQRLSLTAANAPYPSPLQIANWNEASAIDASKPFTLRWNPPQGGLPDDFAQLVVRKLGEVVFRSAAYPGAAGALDGQSTSTVLPAGLLEPGETAEVSLTLLKAHLIDGSSYPQALGTVSCGCETTAAIRASGGALPPPTLSAATLREGAFEFGVAGTAGRLYSVQVSSDFRNWMDVFTTNAPSSAFTLRFQISPMPLVLVRVRGN